MKPFMAKKIIRPGELWHQFEVLKQGGGQSTTGKVAAAHSSQTPPVYIDCIIQNVTQDLRKRYEHPEHPLTGMFLQSGGPMAAAGDALLDESGKSWYIQSVQNPGGLNVWTKYLCSDEPGA